MTTAPSSNNNNKSNNTKGEGEISFGSVYRRREKNLKEGNGPLRKEEEKKNCNVAVACMLGAPVKGIEL